MASDYSTISFMKIGVAVGTFLILVGTITYLGVRYSKSVHDSAQAEEKKSKDIIDDNRHWKIQSLEISFEELLEVGIDDDLQDEDKL
jgi:hypothetical protein